MTGTLKKLHRTFRPARCRADTAVQMGVVRMDTSREDAALRSHMGVCCELWALSYKAARGGLDSESSCKLGFTDQIRRPPRSGRSSWRTSHHQHEPASARRGRSCWIYYRHVWSARRKGSPRAVSSCNFPAVCNFCAPSLMKLPCDIASELLAVAATVRSYPGTLFNGETVQGNSEPSPQDPSFWRTWLQCGDRCSMETVQQRGHGDPLRFCVRIGSHRIASSQTTIVHVGDARGGLAGPQEASPALARGIHVAGPARAARAPPRVRRSHPPRLGCAAHRAYTANRPR